MKKMIEKFLKSKKIVGFLSAVYLIVLLYFLFLSEHMGRTESFVYYRYNLVPFKEITRYITKYRSFGFLRVFINLAGNVLAFVPFGLFLPIFLKSQKKWLKTLLYGLIFVVSIELIQVLTRVGCSDVDDIILNMTGILLGFWGNLFLTKNRSV